MNGSGSKKNAEKENGSKPNAENGSGSKSSGENKNGSRGNGWNVSGMNMRPGWSVIELNTSKGSVKNLSKKDWSWKGSSMRFRSSSRWKRNMNEAESKFSFLQPSALLEKFKFLP